VRLGPRSRVASLIVLGSLLVALQALLRGDDDIRTQVAGQMVAFVLFLPAALLCWRGLGAARVGVVLVLVLAVGMRAAAFDPGGGPPLSTDLYRYAWDARVQAEGINPYRYAPTDPALASLVDSQVWPKINLPDWNTVYPPGAQESFLLARLVFGEGPRASTWLFLLAEAVGVALLLLVLARLGAPLERVAVYAWHPLAVSEIAANGHVDGLTVLAGAGLLAAWQARRFALAGLVVGFGALVRLGPLLLVPALGRRGGWRFVAAALALAVVSGAPYLSVGIGIAGDLRDYVERQRFGGSLWWLLAQELDMRDELVTAVLGAGLLLLVGWIALRAHDDVDQVARSCLLVLGGLLVVLGYVQPWHALWLLPFLVVTPAPGWLWVTGTLPLLYLFGLDRDLPGWVRAVVYGPLGLWVLWRVVAGRRPARRALAPLPAGPRVAAVIPALNEVEALPSLIHELPAGLLDEVVVVDGGSTDGTPEAAEAAGARVVVEQRRGYGRACAAGSAVVAGADVVVFLDGDGSDDPARLAEVLLPVLAGEAALSLGSRAETERGAMHPHQRLGNHFVVLLVRLVYRVPIHDIPPLRAIRADALASLGLTEPTYGWPTEMVVKAARAGLPIAEIPVRSRARRGGESKVSGRFGPSLRAGARMLAVVARYS
jgi:hypothetical protein